MGSAAGERWSCMSRVKAATQLATNWDLHTLTLSPAIGVLTCICRLLKVQLPPEFLTPGLAPKPAAPVAAVHNQQQQPLSRHLVNSSMLPSSHRPVQPPGSLGAWAAPVPRDGLQQVGAEHKPVDQVHTAVLLGACTVACTCDECMGAVGYACSGNQHTLHA